MKSLPSTVTKWCTKESSSATKICASHRCGPRWLAGLGRLLTGGEGGNGASTHGSCEAPPSEPDVVDCQHDLILHPRREQVRVLPHGRRAAVTPMPEMPLVLWSLRYPRRCRTGGAVGAPPGDELRPVAVGPAALLPTPDAFIAQAKSTKWKRALRILS